MAHYLKNKELLEEVHLSKEIGRPTEKLAGMFVLLANHTSQRLYYRNPMDREDCISGAIEDLLRYWHKFDESKSTNAFAYFTQICKNAYAKVWYKLGHKPGDPVIISLTAINYLEGGTNED